MIKKAFRSIFVISMLLALTACSTMSPVMNIENQVVPGSLTLQQVKDGIIIGGAQKKWQMTEVKPGVIHGSIILRQHSAKIVIPYSKDSYSINYSSSDNLSYRNGKIHRNYNKWIILLNETIQKQLRLMSMHSK